MTLTIEIFYSVALIKPMTLANNIKTIHRRYSPIKYNESSSNGLKGETRFTSVRNFLTFNLLHSHF